MFNKAQLEEIAWVVKRQKAKNFSIHFGKISKKELDQIKMIFPEYKIKKSIRGYLDFERLEPICEICGRKIKKPELVWHLGKEICCSDCIFNLVVSKNYEEFKRNLKYCKEGKKL